MIEQLESLGDKFTEFFILAKRKGFHKEEIIKPACIVACSEEMHAIYGDSIKAMEKVIELCKEYADEYEFLEAVVRLAGYEE